MLQIHTLVKHDGKGITAANHTLVKHDDKAVYSHQNFNYGLFKASIC